MTKEWKVGDAFSVAGDHYSHIRGVIMSLTGPPVPMAFYMCWNAAGQEWYTPISPLPTSTLRPWPTDTTERQDDYARAMTCAPEAVREAREPIAESSIVPMGNDSKQKGPTEEEQFGSPHDLDTERTFEW